VFRSNIAELVIKLAAVTRDQDGSKSWVGGSGGRSGWFKKLGWRKWRRQKVGLEEVEGRHFWPSDN